MELWDFELRMCPFTFLLWGISISVAVFVHFYLANRKPDDWLVHACKNRKERLAARILFVIAHPDDECMFFGPAITSLTKPNEKRNVDRRNIFLLCLSDGNADGLGKVRRLELVHSCKILGFHEANIVLHSGKPSFHDNPMAKWDSEYVADAIQHHVKKLKITHIITFDGYGVSGHLNHCSLYDGAIKLKKKCDIQILVLKSVNIFRKYAFCMDSVTEAFNSYVCASSWSIRSVIIAAMKAHKSQYVWFRQVYTTFSRYLFVNSFHLLEDSK